MSDFLTNNVTISSTKSERNGKIFLHGINKLIEWHGKLQQKHMLLENVEGVGQVKLTEGTEIDDFLFLTKNGNCESFRSQLKRDFTAVIFLRHLGCGMSQLDMLKYRDAYQFLKDQGIEIMVVIQGAEAAVSERTAKMKIPYTVIADPEQSLYEHFDIPSSDSMRNLVYGVSEEKLLEFEYYGIECQRFEGNELQLQATIVIDRKGQVVLGHYSANISDVPSPSELYQMLQAVPVRS